MSCIDKGAKALKNGLVDSLGVKSLVFCNMQIFNI